MKEQQVKVAAFGLQFETLNIKYDQIIKLSNVQF